MQQNGAVATAAGAVFVLLRSHGNKSQHKHQRCQHTSRMRSNLTVEADWRQCSNSTPIFIGMHRNTPLSPMKRVPGHTTSHWLRRQAAMRLRSGRAFALNTAPSLTAAEPSPDTAQRAMRFVVRCVEMCPGGHITQYHQIPNSNSAQCTTGLRGSARTALKSICESSISSTSPITAL